MKFSAILKSIIMHAMQLKDRIPSIGMILPVYAVIAFLVFAWTIVNFLWEFSSWIFYLSAGEIGIIFAYSMTSALLESVVLLAILLLICLVLPREWMREVFITRGSTIAIFGLGFIMLSVYKYTENGFAFIPLLPIYSLAGLGLTLTMAFISTRIRGWIRAISWLSDQLIIFLFILIPLSLTSLIIVGIRNIF